MTLDGIGLYRALRRVNPSPYLFFVRTPGYEVVGATVEDLRRQDLLVVEDSRVRATPRGLAVLNRLAVEFLPVPG